MRIIKVNGVIYPYLSLSSTEEDLSIQFPKHLFLLGAELMSCRILVVVRSECFDPQKKAHPEFEDSFSSYYLF
jgi:hypothetical protein